MLTLSIGPTNAHIQNNNKQTVEHVTNQNRFNRKDENERTHKADQSCLPAASATKGM